VTTGLSSGPLERWGRIGGVAGVAFVVLTIAGGLVQGDVPVYTDSPAVIKEWFADNGDAYLVGGFLIVVGALFYLAFLAVLVAALFAAEEPRGPWPWLALLAGIGVVVAAQTSSAFDPTLALLEGDVSDDLARGLSAADYLTFLLLYPFAGVLALAASLTIARTGVLWRPLAWFGPPIALGGLVALAAPLQHDAEGTLTTVGYLTLFAFLVWVACVSASMIHAGRKGSPRTPR
jgi:hypothetical protein